MVKSIELVKILIEDTNLLKKWNYFCNVLEIPNTEIVLLKRQFNTNTIKIEDQFLEIIDCWVAKTAKATVGDLVRILREERFNYVADKLEEEYKLTDSISCSPIPRPTPTINPPIWYNVKRPCEDFKDRDKELLQMQNYFDNPVGHHKIFFISGKKLIGKTEVARKFAVNFQEKLKGSCIWIDSDTTLDQFLTSYGLGSILDLGKLHNDLKWLIVFDKAKEELEKTLDKFSELPSSSQEPFIIVISRNQRNLTSLTYNHLNLDYPLGNGVRYLWYIFKHLTPWVIQNGGNENACTQILNFLSATLLTQPDQILCWFNLIVYFIQEDNHKIIVPNPFKFACSPQELNGILKCDKLIKQDGTIEQGYYYVSCSLTEAPFTLTKYLSHSFCNTFSWRLVPRPFFHPISSLIESIDGANKNRFTNFCNYKKLFKLIFIDSFLQKFSSQMILKMFVVADKRRFTNIILTFNCELKTLKMLNNKLTHELGETDECSIEVSRNLGKRFFKLEMYEDSLTIYKRLYKINKDKEDGEMFVHCLNRLKRHSEANALKQLTYNRD